MATTYNFTNGSITGQPKCNDTLPNTTGPFLRSNIVDFANQNLDASATDVAQVINVPADTWVDRLFIRIITAETANASFEIGSGLDVDQWATAFALGSTGNNIADIIDAPEYFAAADTIDLTCTGSVDIDAAKLEIVALMIPGNKSDADGGTQHST